MKNRDGESKSFSQEKNLHKNHGKRFQGHFFLEVKFLMRKFS